ncbi:MAG: HK97 family phage prohead protease [Elusimicrobia bacterium]|nr:HK97 family phage prohead protease [Elusimicrobiota bacterium]
MNAIETRTVVVGTCELELRAAGEGKKMPGLVGYPALYDSRSSDLGGFVETIRQGTFSGALQRAKDVVATINHDRGKVLGRYPDPGTVRLSNNQKGLRMEIDELPDTSFARDMVESLRRGDVRGMSFAFRTIEDAWREEIVDGQKMVVRELRDLELHDVSVVTDPAYPATEVGLRSLELFRAKARDGIGMFEMRLRLAEATK